MVILSILGGAPGVQVAIDNHGSVVQTTGEDAASHPLRAPRVGLVRGGGGGKEEGREGEKMTKRIKPNTYAHTCMFNGAITHTHEQYIYMYVLPLVPSAHFHC